MPGRRSGPSSHIRPFHIFASNRRQNPIGHWFDAVRLSGFDTFAIVGSQANVDRLFETSLAPPVKVADQRSAVKAFANKYEWFFKAVSQRTPS